MYKLIVAILLTIFVVQTYSTCGANCDNDNQCTGSVCTYCDPNSKVCSQGGQCGATCQVDLDCDLECALCVGGKCTAPTVNCNDKCENDNDCLNPRCSYCNFGRCSPGLLCNATCKVTLDCNQNSNCSDCVVGKCFATCGRQCGSDSECDPNSCSYCDPNGWLCQYPPSTPVQKQISAEAEPVKESLEEKIFEGVEAEAKKIKHKLDNMKKMFSRAANKHN
eukprot:TRINITY_DN76464_c0_g1_i2.p1 TRINITY_DN76464_c0_g1~~TRINITY_DN76464_c0_g1_i2.p1  ORF type:complete len:221 (+),score=55.00 TRINITY_DN76464_c0_g1_i2:41-703(+)